MSHVVASLSVGVPRRRGLLRPVACATSATRSPIPSSSARSPGSSARRPIHGREHRALNDQLDELGYPAKRIERFTKWGLAKREQIMSPHSNLAATAALEHFTATLAEVILARPRGPPALRQRGRHQPAPVARARGVRAQGRRLRRLQGGRRQRAHPHPHHEHHHRRLHRRHDPAVDHLAARRPRRPTEPGTLARSVKRLRTSPFLRKEVWRQLRDYNRPDFHPDDQDTDRAGRRVARASSSATTAR